MTDDEILSLIKQVEDLKRSPHRYESQYTEGNNDALDEVITLVLEPQLSEKLRRHRAIQDRIQMVARLMEFNRMLNIRSESIRLTGEDL